jgi:hypothetical protein
MIVISFFDKINIFWKLFLRNRNYLILFADLEYAARLKKLESLGCNWGERCTIIQIR